MNISKVPSQVWVGNAQILKKQALLFLQNQFCLSSVISQVSLDVSGESAEPGACLNCFICRQIKEDQYYNILWLAPEGSYKVEQVRDVLARLSLRLSSSERFYVVFQDAHCLNEASANSLLKSIEEPPAGYHFLFLTPRKELILDTILSRSLIKQFGGDDDVNHDIFTCFTSKNLNPVEFIALLEKHKDLNEQDSRTLLDQIYGYWLNQAKKNLDTNELVKINQIIAVLQQAQDFAPMPGSSKLFWRDLYLQFK